MTETYEPRAALWCHKRGQTPYLKNRRLYIVIGNCSSTQTSTSIGSVPSIFAWIDKLKALVRFSRKDAYFFGLHYLAFALITLRDLVA